MAAVWRSWSPSQANEFIYRAAVAHAWAADRAGLADDLEELDATGVHGRVAAARRLTSRPRLAALGGTGDGGVALYRRGVAAWRELRIVWDEALTALTMVKLLDPALPEVRKAAAARRRARS